MRDRVWKFVTRKQPEGMLLPWWLLTVRAILYPLDFFYWKLSRTRGYQLETDIWHIEGVKYSGAALRALANAQGEIYKITRTGDVVTLERAE